MLPSDQFVLFYNEIFKFLEQQGSDALRKYYDRIAKRQEDFCLKQFQEMGLKGMYDYWERIRIEENCDSWRRFAADGSYLEGGQNVCPSLSKVLESETGPCRVYCDHCPGWVLPVMTKAGYYYVYNLISRTKPSCLNFITPFANRALAEDRQNLWLEEVGDDLVRSNLEPSMYRGTIAKSRNFENLHPRLKKAFAFLRETDLAALPLGRTTIDGDDIFANVMEPTLGKYGPDAKLEAHRRYIDIQTPLTGEETLGYIYDKAGVDARASEFNVNDDYVLYRNPAMRQITLRPGEFVAFLPPYGAHAPGRTLGEPRKIRKVVVKVRM
jgi:YhcH/YjgK/YiaL family protein